MKLQPWRYWLVMPIGLLVGCQSQKAVFSFSPPAAPTAVPTAPAFGSESTLALLPATLAARPVPARPSAAAPAPVRSAQRPYQPAGLLRQGRLPAEAAAHSVVPRLGRRPFGKPRPETVHLVMGIALVVGGVVAGLLVGSWAGLGIGAVVVLLGYYFLLLGLGGKHAWLEVFQEFFNL